MTTKKTFINKYRRNLKVKRNFDIEQDELIDNFGGIVKKIKNQNRAISEELESQSPKIKNLGNKMESVENKMKKTEGKLDSYIEQSSNSCLMMTICIEFVLLLLFLLI